MTTQQAVDYLLLATLLLVSLALAGTSLWRTSRWDFLGRALLLHFVGQAMLWAYAIAARAWGPFPAWALWAVRVGLVASGILLMAALLRYPWSAARPGVAWRGLLGLGENGGNRE